MRLIICVSLVSDIAIFVLKGDVKLQLTIFVSHMNLQNKNIILWY